ncbi:uncharacterized protein MAM_04608 [Metarhizium album ARSEF 1941]|uniref:Single-strand DNA deaminase toxin A-like C-terminal domain-containing protein n=1 Tax=Metarhizium album (strain ARSEF 1941) TaxID=1081103 RepID=A0A0B2WU51_METAS|nr:uncharacterized protein MAM_04608 [Metarhizium album ARSEF 1941]KHN97593.1 hypothetical protein MAM_04608 [Metarhizium album ARSEF 1941]
MSGTAPATDPPSFDSRFSSPEALFYFYHKIDASTGTLQSQVLGPNVSKTFPHARALAHCTPARIQSVLARKTTGFLALLGPGTSPTRTILAWAESGHGHNPRGDFLEPEPRSAVLSNRRWTARAIRLGREVGINMRHPYDGLARGGRAGIFRASHVEVKLAVHAVYILVRMAGMPTGRVARADLAALRGRAWCGGARPRFEIYFSKKNCCGCAEYVRRLEGLTGAEITLCWRERLVEMDYDKCRMGVVPDAEGVTAAEAHGGHERREGTGGSVQVVDLADEADDGSSQESRDEVVEVTPEPLGAYLDGLAYCVGQTGDGARVVRAVVGLAKMWKRQAAVRRGDAGRAAERTSGSWLATPPAPGVRAQRQGATWTEAERRGAESDCVVVGERVPRRYSFVRGQLAAG